VGEKLPAAVLKPAVPVVQAAVAAPPVEKVPARHALVVPAAWPARQ